MLQYAFTILDKIVMVSFRFNVFTLPGTPSKSRISLICADLICGAFIIFLKFLMNS